MRRNVSRKPAYPMASLRRRTTRLLIERLEDRYLLAVAAYAQTGSTLAAALAPNQNVTLTAVGPTETLTLPSGDTWSGASVAGVTGNGTATLSVTPAQAPFNAIEITDSGTNAGDAATFADSGGSTYAHSVQVSLTNAGAGPIVFNGATRFTGSSALSAATAANITVSSGASLTTVNGNLSLNGGSANGTAVLIGGASTAVSTVNGNISITGASTGPAAATNVHGIEVSGAVVQATGTGQITLNGSSPAGSSNIGTDITRGGRVTAGGGDATKALGLAAGSTIVVALDPTRATTTGYQYVHVDGSVNVGGATLQSTGTGALPSGGSYTVVNPQSSTSTGVFNGLAQGRSTTIGGSQYVVTYVGGNGGNAMLLEEDPPSVQAGGLQFQAVDGGGFTVNGTTDTATGDVQVGFVPTGGASFTPLLLLTGDTTVDTSASTVASTGAVSAVISGPPIGLISSLPTTSIASLISASGVNGLSGTTFTAAGVAFTLNTLELSPTGNAGQPEVLLQGAVVLPTVGLTVAVNGSNFVDINSSGVTLTGVSASLNGSFMLAGATFTASALTAQYTPTNNVFTVTGGASVAVSGIAGLSVSFGYGTGASALPGLVVSNGTLASVVNMTVNGSFTVSQVAITATGLDFTYATATQTFGFSGTAGVSVTGIANLRVAFGHTAVNGSVTPGLVITSGTLTTLDMTIETNIAIGSVTFATTGLELTYSGATSQFALAGTVGLSISGIASLSVSFGHTAGGNVTPGLVITSGSLQSLDMTIETNITVASVTFATTGLELTYSAAASQFALAGTVGLSISGIASLSVSFGHTASDGSVTPGLIITSGTLQSLDMTVESFAVASVTITGTDLQLTYDAVATQFMLSGTADVSVTGGMGNLTVAFGHTASDGSVTPGLSLANGTLQSLDMTVNGTLTAASVLIFATDLQLIYSAASSQFNLSGTAAVSITGIAGLSVSFGHTASDGSVTPGLIITSGTLQSLDMTVGSFSVASVTITGTDLQLTYDTVGAQFNLSGTADVSVADLGNVTVVFGHTAANGSVTPGLSLSGGALQSLDMTVNGSLTASSVEISATDLQLTYSAASSQFNLSGAAAVSITGIAGLSVSFGHTASDGSVTPGLIITSGTLQSLDMTVGSFSVASVTITGTDLQLTYDTVGAQFNLSGTADVSVGDLGNLTVVFGHTAANGSVTPGLSLSGGALQSLDMTVNGSLTASSVMISATDLQLTYSRASSQFNLAGTADVSISGLASISVSFGHTASDGGVTPGLIIASGSLQSLDMTVVSFAVAGVAITGTDLQFTYAAAGSQFNLSGAADVSITGIASLSVVFGHTAANGSVTPGLSLSGGALQSLDMTVDGEFSVAGVTITATDLQVTYSAASSQFNLAGAAAVSISGLGSISVSFGHTAAGGGVTPGLVVSSGSLQSLDMTVNGEFSVARVTISATVLEITYSAASSQFSLQGGAGVLITGLAGLSVSFGHTATNGSVTPGLIVSSGSLQALDMTVASLTIPGVTVSVTDVQFTYNAASSQFNLSGAAAFSITGIVGLSVTFGHSVGPNSFSPGVVVSSGSLQSLDMTINSNISIGSVSFMTTGLEFMYSAAVSQFTLAGSVGLSITGIAGLSVTFGYSVGPNSFRPGLIVASGSLQSLDMTINSNVSIGSVSFMTTGLEFTYSAAKSQFTLAGSVGVSITGIAGLSVTFGQNNGGNRFTPGLIIASGSLQLLAMTINSNIMIGPVTLHDERLCVHLQFRRQHVLAGR